VHPGVTLNSLGSVWWTLCLVVTKNFFLQELCVGFLDFFTLRGVTCIFPSIGDATSPWLSGWNWIDSGRQRKPSCSSMSDEYFGFFVCRYFDPRKRGEQVDGFRVSFPSLCVPPAAANAIYVCEPHVVPTFIILGVPPVGIIYCISFHCSTYEVWQQGRC